MKFAFLKAAWILLSLLVYQSATAQTTPSCSDKRTIRLVIEEVRERVVPGTQYKNIDLQTYLDHMKVDRPAPTAYQKEIQQFSCSATLTTDNKAGADPFGAAILSSPQALYDAGSSISELEGFLHRDADFENWKYSFQISYVSRIVDGKHQVSIVPVHQIRALLIGTFVAAYAKQKNLNSSN